MIYDLAAKIWALPGASPRERMAEAIQVLPPVGLVALNGIPFIGDPPTYFGVQIRPEIIREQLRFGLGFGGVLTYMNPGQHTLNELAEISLEHGHDWAMKSITLTLCFAGCPTFVELSFARDRRFHLSWVEPKGPEDWSKARVFTATATAKDWKKYVGNRASQDFLRTQREWLAMAHEVLKSLMPEYFG